MSDKPLLVTKPGCPFAERTQIVLSAKQIDYELTEISLHDKPDWFVANSPLEKVPLLRHGDEHLVESTIINAYLDEVFPEPALMPIEPVSRAEARYWILFDETRLVPAFYALVMGQTNETRARGRDRLERELQRLIADGLNGEHNFLVGDTASMADITLFTHLRRLSFLRPHRDLPKNVQSEALTTWIARMSSLPFVEGALATDDVVSRDLVPYLEGKAAGTTAEDMLAAQ